MTQGGEQLRRVIPLRGSLFLVLGMVIGTGIYKTPASVAGAVPHFGWILGLWAVGGLIALTAALCYAELATSYPRSGGDYHYLRLAYGPWAGFLFGWTKTFIVRPVTIALLAIIAAEHTRDLFDMPGLPVTPIATGYIAASALLNIIGTRISVGFNTALTVLKVTGLGLIIGVGLLLGDGASWHESVARDSSDSALLGGIPLALIAIMWSYGGAAELAILGGEVDDPRRNLPRALIAGVVVVTVLYLLAVTAFHSVVTPAELAASQEQPLPLIVSRTLGAWAGDDAGLMKRVAALIVVLSAVGITHTMILSGGRITYTFGHEMPGLGWASRIHSRFGTPAAAIVFLCVVAVGFCALGQGRFEALMVFSGFGDWFLYTMTAISLVILRRRRPDAERPYRVFLPLVWPVYTLACLVLFASTIQSFLTDREGVEWWWIGPALLGAGLVLAFAIGGRRASNDQPGGP